MAKFNPFNKGDWDKLGGKTKDEFNKVEKAIREVEKDAKRSIEAERKQAWNSLKSMGNKVTRDIQQAGDAQIRSIERKAGDAVSEALAELERAITKQGLRMVRDGIRTADREIEALRKAKPDLAAALDIPGGSVKLGPMTLQYSGFFTRTAKLADSLDHYVNDPPQFRRGPLLSLIEALGPDSVDLGIDISAALVVVQSETLSAGFSADDLPMEVFVEVADAILEACGVPE